jgi:hypothetical protein
MFSFLFALNISSNALIFNYLIFYFFWVLLKSLYSSFDNHDLNLRLQSLARNIVIYNYSRNINISFLIVLKA